MADEGLVRIISGLGLLAFSQLLPYINPEKDKGVRALYFIIHGLLSSIGLFLLTMTMGDVTLFWVSFPPFVVIVPLGALWLIKRIAERSNDNNFKNEAKAYDDKFKNYFTSWWELIKSIFTSFWSLPLNIWSFFIYYAVEVLKIIKMPFDAVYNGLVSVSGSAGRGVDASFNGVKGGLNEVRRYFKVLFVDALWEIVSLGGEICCSVLPPPFNKSTKCRTQGKCISTTDRTAKARSGYELKEPPKIAEPFDPNSLPQIIPRISNSDLIAAAKGDNAAFNRIMFSPGGDRWFDLGDDIINDLKSGDPKAVGRSLVRVGNTAWEGANEFANDMKERGESLGRSAQKFGQDIGKGASDTGEAVVSFFTGLSDVRLKKNITRVGTFKKGVGIYTWQWTQKAIRLGANPKRTRGVLAQEVARVDPEAVIKGPEGFLLVSKKYDV